MTNSLTIAHNPFDFDRIRTVDVEGASIWQMLQRHGFSEHSRAHVFVDGEIVARDQWETYRPRAGAHVDVRVLPTGGDDNKVLRTVLTIAVIALSMYTAGAVGAAYGAGWGAVAGAAVSYAGQFLINELVPPAAPELDEGNGKQDSPNFAIEGARNTAQPFGVLPQILGRKRIYPPYAAQPYTEVIGDEQWLRMLFDISYGPVELAGFRIGETDLDEFSDYEISIDTGDGNGWSNGVLYPSTANEQQLNILLEESAGYTLRTTDPDVDEISVDVTAAALIGFDSSGDREYRTVNVEMQYAPTGTSDWSIGLVAESFPARTQGGIDADSSRGELHYYKVCMRRDTGELLVVKGQPKFINPLPSPTFDPTIPATPPYAWPIALVLRDFGDATIPASEITDIRSDELLAQVSDPGDFAPSHNGSADSIDVAAGELSGQISITGRTTSAVRESVRFPVPRGQYDVRLRRVTPDSSDDNIRDEVYWSALRTFVDEEPVNEPGRALVALRVKATDQLNGIIDRFNVVAAALIPEWDGTQWVANQPTTNPAAIYRHVLQGSANKQALADARQALPSLEHWHEVCTAEGRGYSSYIDYKAVLGDLLREIASVGRAAPAILDGGKHGVVVDEEKTTVRQHFTPRNTWNFQSTKQFRTPADAIEVRFTNAEKDWRQDNVRISPDGEDPDAATNVQQLEMVGIFDVDHAQKEGRYYMAVERLRPETYTWECDIEHLVCTRGDLVRMTHDVPMWGIESTRIKSVTTAGSGDVTHITVDEPCTMEAGTSYAVRIRLSDGTSVVRSLVTVAGDQTELEIATPIGTSPLPAAGDLVQFGELNSESVELIIKAIEPGPDMSARIIAKDHAPAVHDAGTIPAFDSQITDTLPPPVPDIRYIQGIEETQAYGYQGVVISDVEVRLNGQLSTRLSDVTGVEVQYRTEDTSEQWNSIVVDRGRLSIVIPRLQILFTYDVRARYLLGDRAGAWTDTESITVTADFLPDVRRLSASQNGNVVVIKWAAISIIDAVGTVLRYGKVGSSFENSKPLTEAARGTAITDAQIPPGEWTIWARHVDANRNKSANPTSTTVTVKGTYDIIIQRDEGPAWLGTADRWYRHWTGVLMPTSQGVATDDGWDTFDTYVPQPYDEYVYEALEQDVGFDDDVRVWGDIEASMGPGETGEVSPDLEVRSHLDGDPYGAWQDWTIGLLDARFVQHRLIVDPANGLAYIEQFTPTTDLLEHTATMDDVAIGSSGTSVTFPQEFHRVPRVSIAPQGSSPVYATYDNVTTTGCDVYLWDGGTGSGTAGTVRIDIIGV